MVTSHSQQQPKEGSRIFSQSRLFMGLLFAALLISACQPLQLSTAAQTSQAEAQGLRPDAPLYAVRGPFAVGYTPLVISVGSESPIDAGLWYPALNPTDANEAVTYVFTPKTPELTIDAPTVVYGKAIFEASVDESGAPYPLVIFSHGFGLNAAWYHTLLEHYASHGFIVLAPEHVEGDWFGSMTAAIERPREIKQTLDYAEQLTAPDGDLAGQIDMEHVAVVGHSYGGYTALAMAGAQFDFDALNARCATLASEDPKTFLCMPLIGNEAEMATLAGFNGVPEGLWPSIGDPRVSAIIPMAGDAYLFDAAGMSSVTVPMMAIGGTADTGTPYDWGSKPSYQYASSAQKVRVSLEGAEHMVAGSPCEHMPWASQIPFYEFMCLDPVWDKARALDLIHHFSTAFLLDTLKSDEQAHTALLPDAVQFPGIDYATTLK